MTVLLLLACIDADARGDSAVAPDTSDTGEEAVVTDDPPESVVLEGLCPLDTRHGAFYVEAYDSYSAVYGEVSDGVVPNTVLTEVAVDGACRLMRTENPYCDPPCSAGETCDLDSTCIAYPSTQDLGTVSVSGLVEAVAMEPVSPGFSYFDTSLPHPIYTDEQVIELTTSGATLDPFVLHGVGFDVLTLDTASWTVAEHTSVPLAWAGAAKDTQTEVFVELNIDQHGTSPLTVWCVFEDTGSAEIPATVIDALLDAGVTGYPSGRVTRRTVDSTTAGDGCVDLTVASPVGASIDVAGYTPCTSDLDCPPNQSCNLALQVCE